MTELQEIFSVKYGVNLELNKLKRDPEGINFVSRTAKNNGVSARVKRLPQVKPIEAGVLTVAGGGSVLETFLQPEPFYSGRDLYYLKPKINLTTAEKLFYCTCIRMNKYKYSYGRQANRSLRKLSVPSMDEIPKWVRKMNSVQFDGVEKPYSNVLMAFETKQWKPFRYSDLFNIERGRGPRKKDLDGSGSTPFITSSDSNNGLTNYTAEESIHEGNTIGVNRNGSVAEAFYQPVSFCSTEDVHIFIPKFKLNQYIAMFLITLIKQEKYRYNYGRKWGIDRMNKSVFYLPVKASGKIDWEFMENYIKTLPYSSSI